MSRIVDKMQPTPTPATTDRPARKQRGFIIAIGLTLGIIFMGGDAIRIGLGPLDYLSMPYPHIFKYTHFIAPIAALVLWIVFKRTAVVAIIAYLLAVAAIVSVAVWCDSQPIKIPITRMIDSDEWVAWQNKVGFKVWEQGDSHGTFMWVDRTPGRADQAMAEAKQMGILKP